MICYYCLTTQFSRSSIKKKHWKICPRMLAADHYIYMYMYHYVWTSDNSSTNLSIRSPAVIVIHVHTCILYIHLSCTFLSFQVFEILMICSFSKLIASDELLIKVFKWLLIVFFFFFFISIESIEKAIELRTWVKLSKSRRFYPVW